MLSLSASTKPGRDRRRTSTVAGATCECVAWISNRPAGSPVRSAKPPESGHEIRRKKADVMETITTVSSPLAHSDGVCHKRILRALCYAHVMLADHRQTRRGGVVDFGESSKKIAHLVIPFSVAFARLCGLGPHPNPPLKGEGVRTPPQPFPQRGGRRFVVPSI